LAFLFKLDKLKVAAFALNKKEQRMGTGIQTLRFENYDQERALVMINTQD
jgi:hypothetical protein